MKQLKDVDNRLLHPHGDKEQETAALQRARTWLAEITDLVTNEPWLMPKSIPVKRQPIEQPRDLAAA